MSLSKIPTAWRVAIIEDRPCPAEWIKYYEYGRPSCPIDEAGCWKVGHPNHYKSNRPDLIVRSLDLVYLSDADDVSHLLTQIEFLQKRLSETEAIITNHSIGMLNQIGLSGHDADMILRTA